MSHSPPLDEEIQSAAVRVLPDLSITDSTGLLL